MRSLDGEVVCKERGRVCKSFQEKRPPKFSGS